MPSAGEERFNECLQDLGDRFTTYDQAVDVVSCWQSVFEHLHADELTYFDRYPRMGENRLTPDFGVLFGEDYGIVGEVKRTFPMGDVAFKSVMQQLMNYDAPLPFRTGDDEVINPQNHDIMLITHHLDCSEVMGRIQQLLEDPDSGISFERNLVIIGYTYDAGDRLSHYIFEKPPYENRPFTDTCLPEENRLEAIMGERRQKIRVSPGQFINYKVTQVFCNDPPPPLYTAVYLWMKVFWDYLSEDQWVIWRRKNPQTILPIEIIPRHLHQKINEEYIPRGGVKIGWLKDALEFLCQAGLAEKKEGNRYMVKFRNFTGKVGRREFTEEGEERIEELREYGSLLAHWFCNNLHLKKLKTQPSTPSKESVQRKLFESSGE